MSIYWDGGTATSEGERRYRGEVLTTGCRPPECYHELFVGREGEWAFEVWCAQCEKRLMFVGGIYTAHHDGLESYSEEIAPLVHAHYRESHPHVTVREATCSH